MKTDAIQYLPYVTIDGAKTGVNSVAFKPDGTTLAIDNDNTIRLWDVATGQEKKMLWVDIGRNITAVVNSIAFSPDGQMLAGGVHEPETICLWDADAGEQLKTMREDTSKALHWVNTVAFSPDSKMLASGSEDGNLYLWDVATGEKLKTLTEDAENVFQRCVQ